MSRTRHRMWQSFISVVLAICLAFSMTVPAFAYPPKDGNDDGVINYVSLGDSMTNGYGFIGYEQGEDGFTINDEDGQYGESAYPNLFASWLERQGYEVNHSKLAVSGMRAEELNYLLGGREMPTDFWGINQLHHYSGVVDDAELQAIFQEAIADADVVTMGIGNASFGAYLVQYVTRSMGVMDGSLPEEEKVDLEKALATLNPEQKAVVVEAYDKMLAELAKYDSIGVTQSEDLKDILDVLTYVSVGFILNYECALDKMIELNPDAEIILVGLMNTAYGMEVTGEGIDPVPFGDIVGVLFDSMNAYIAALPTVKQAAGEWTDATFYYAEQTEPEFIVQVFDDMAAAGWPSSGYEGLSTDIVRGRTIDAYNDDLREMIGSVLEMNLPPITVEDVASYKFDEGDQYSITLEFFGQAAQYNGSNADDLPLVKRYIDLTSDLGLEQAPARFSTVFAAEIEKEISIAIYAALEESLVESVDTMEITLEGLMGIAGNIFAALGEMPAGLNPDNNPGPYTIKTELVNWFTGSETGLAMCKIFAMFKVGDGMSVHPTPKAHGGIADEIINAYSTGYTAKDETVNNLVAAGEAAAALVAEYYDEAYAYAYAEAKNAGYIDQAVAGINGIIAELKAIDLSGTEMTDEFKAELQASITEAVETLEAAKALVLEADVLDQASLDDLMALLAEAGDDIEGVMAMLEQAGYDATTLAVIPVLEAAYTKLTDEVVPQICADLQKAVEAGAEWLAAQLEQACADFIVAVKEAAAKYAPEAADAIYNYLLNNPEDVLAFLNEYGDDAVAFLGQYEQEIFAVLGFLAVNYGDDVLCYVLENADEILVALVDLVEEYGDEAWELIKVYADASGLTAAVQAEIDALEAQLEALRAQLESDLGALDAEVKAEIEKQIAVIEAQIAELEALLAELNEAFLSGKAEVEAVLAEINAAYTELMAAVEALEAAAQALSADIQAAIAEVVAAAEALQAAIDALVNDVAAFAQDVMDLYKSIVGFIDDLYGDIIEQAQKAFENLDAKITEIFDSLDAQIADALDKLGAEATAALKAALAKAEAELHALIAEAIQAIIDGTFDAEALQSLIDGMYAALDELEAALDGLDAEIAAAVKAQIANLKVQIALIENLVANYLAAAVEDATHGEYVITETSRYAAIGDATILAEGSYADQLAAKLAEIAAAEGASFDPAVQYDKLALVDESDGVATTADILAKIQSGDWNEAIANADIISVSVGAEDLTVAAGEQLGAILNGYINAALAGEKYESVDSTDWSTYVGAEGAAYVDAIVGDIYAELLKSIGDEGAAAMATDVIEAYAFAYVGFATNYAPVLNEIQALSPDAQVVVVGPNNVFDGLILNFGEEQVNVGEYADYVVKAADLQFLAYSMLDEGGNVTFVSAPEADSPAVDVINGIIETLASVDLKLLMAIASGDTSILGSLGLDLNGMLELLEQLTATLNSVIAQIDQLAETGSWMPNASGQEYILGQILGAMTFTVEKAEEPVVKHTVTFETNDGRCAFIINGDYDNPYFEGSIEVADGESLTFLVAVEFEYELESLFVDGIDVTADLVENTYTIESVTKDMVISGKAVVSEQPAGEWKRLAGTGYNRYSTMDAIATEGFSATGGTVIVAYSLNYPDALAASGLAGIHKAPIILTDTDAMTDLAIGQLERLAPSRVIVVGSEGVVSENVVNEIAVAAPNAEIERYCGPNRYATALDIYNETEGWGNTAIVAGGLTFADALSISPYAYATKSPIFLTSGSGTYEDNPVLDEASIEAIKAGGFERIVVVGGETCVDTAALAASLGIEVSDLEVLAGKNRYETSALIAEFAVSEGLSYDGIAIATGDNFPDALTGGPLCGKNGSVLLLAGDSLGNGSLNVIYDVVGAHADEIGYGYFLGSERVVTEAMVNAVYECLGITA